jgi:Tol biopolymer transport system component
MASSALPNSDWTLATMNSRGGDRYAIEGAERADWCEWSPDGEAVAYVRRGKVHVHWLRTAREVMVDCGNRLVAGFSWFPDSSHILLDWGLLHSPTYGLSVADVASGHSQELTVGGAVISAAAVSPVGDEVAYGNDTTGLTIAKLEGLCLGDSALLAPLGSGERISWIGWSPDARFVAFIKRSVLPAPDTQALCVVQRLGGKTWELWRVYGAEMIASPRWHPRRPALSFRAGDPGGGNMVLKTSSLRGQEWLTSEIATPRGMVSGVAGWSPDGKLLAYSVFASESGRIYVCDEDGSHARAVSPPRALDSMPQWRPVAGN